MRKLKYLFLLAAAVLASGCSAPAPYKNCIDCSQYPLVYQGSIVKYTQGVYLETACIIVDLSKFTGFENFELGDIIYIEYVIKQGEFCSKNDSSIYNLYTIKTDKDGSFPSELTGPGDGINIK